MLTDIENNSHWNDFVHCNFHVQRATLQTKISSKSKKKALKKSIVLTIKTTITFYSFPKHFVRPEIPWYFHVFQDFWDSCRA